MVKQIRLIKMVFVLLMLSFGGGRNAAATPPTFPATVRFIENQGQWDTAARFRATTRDGVLWLTDDALWLSYRQAEQGQLNIRLTFPGHNPQARLEPFNRQDVVISYFRGQDRANWHGGVPVWGGVWVRDLYPGVDLLLTGEDGRITPIFVGDGGPVTMQIEGADEVELRGRELLFHSSAGTFTWPVSGGSEQWAVSSLQSPVSSLSISHSPSNSSALIFGTFIGGEDVLPDAAYDIALDSQENVYMTGYTETTNFPNQPGMAPEHGIDVIITKLLPDGSDLAYAIHINPSAFNQPDWGYGIFVNEQGEAYVVGETNSDDFPITPDAFDSNFVDGEAFFLKVTADGTDLLYSTFLGGSDLDGARAISRDPQGNFYITGQTWSADFPITTNAPDPTHNGLRDAFVTKLNPSGTAILYSTFLGGAVQEQGMAIVVDAAGQATVAGWTNSANFPTTSGAYDEIYNGAFDGFVTRLNSSGTALIYSTFLGGSNEDRINDLILHDGGRVTVTGTTLSPFPTTPGAYNPTHQGDYDAFVTQLNHNGSGLIFSTFLGGTGEERGFGLNLSSSGDILVTGRTSSANFPTTPNAFDSNLNGLADAFVTRLNSTGTAVTYSSFLGGNDVDEAHTVTVGLDGSLFLAGTTRSADFPVTPGAYRTTINGDYDVFIVKMTVSQLLDIYLPLLLRP
ncbi:MAG: hypothetical protein KJ063_18815 [Anaerolineae bacterium]|nr:hypothetical protein [Anaerolineae bacterium]